MKVKDFYPDAVKRWIDETGLGTGSHVVPVRDAIAHFKQWSVGKIPFCGGFLRRELAIHFPVLLIKYRNPNTEKGWTSARCFGMNMDLGTSLKNEEKI